jgi:hypothetical protein
MIGKLQTYLEENDLDSAQGVMDKLAAIKDQLPEDLRARIEQLREKMTDMTEADTAG